MYVLKIGKNPKAGWAWHATILCLVSTGMISFLEWVLYESIYLYNPGITCLVKVGPHLVTL